MVLRISTKLYIFNSFSIPDHSECDHVLNISTALLLTTSAVCSICPRKVSSDTIGLDKCITVLIVDSIKINVKRMYLFMFLFGHSTNGINGLVWVNLDTGVFISRLTPDSDRQLEYWYTNIYCIVVSIYILMRCVLSVSVLTLLVAD